MSTPRASWSRRMADKAFYWRLNASHALRETRITLSLADMPILPVREDERSSGANSGWVVWRFLFVCVRCERPYGWWSGPKEVS